MTTASSRHLVRPTWVAVADAPNAPIPPANPAGAIQVALPFQETIFITGGHPDGVSYALKLDEGQVVDVELDRDPEAPPPLLDVFEHIPPADYQPTAHLRRSGATFRFEAPRAGDYLLRIRATPGDSGRYHLALGVPGELLFPVAGGEAGWVRGHFGDPRDRGARKHEGLDIFAPRGTPVVAVHDAVVTRVERTATGGRVIWCEDELRGVTYFYAHLDRQLVRRGEHLAAGDTIGTVGNTGNARSSSPHLHFAAYLPGLVAIDPAPLLAGNETLDAPLLPDSALAGLGSWARTRARTVHLRSAPEQAAQVLAELGEGTVVRLVGAVEEWRRVQLEDGAAGFVANWLLEPFAGTR